MMTKLLLCSVLSVTTAVEFKGQAEEARVAPLAKGQKAPVLVMQGLDNNKVDLQKVFAEGTTVLVMLRGYPGYQCPICSRQVGEYRKIAEDLVKADVRVVLVYPGAVGNLKQRAEEFLKHAKLPAPLTMVLDPDYRLTDAYGLRWEAPRETAYPSTFVIDSKRVVHFAKVSKSHGGRVPADKALEEAKKVPQGEAE